jgi:alkylated DNA repair dioxygenase AlkB
VGASPISVWQPSLFSSGDAPAIDRSLSELERVWLDADSWVDHVPGWLGDSDVVFEQVLTTRAWQQRTRHMYDRRVQEPRLTAPWDAASGKPLQPGILEDIRQALCERYERTFDSVGFNLYRDGRDSVAWHADRIPPEIEAPVVALVSLGEPRPFRLRPKGQGANATRTFFLGRGDLLVTGGNTQRTWEHAVPRIAAAGPRISLAYRHGMDPDENAHKGSQP